jgi:hypothetical protein
LIGARRSELRQFIDEVVRRRARERNGKYSVRLHILFKQARDAAHESVGFACTRPGNNSQLRASICGDVQRGSE